MPGSAATLSRARHREVLRQAVSVGAATGAYGVSFGALAVAAGLSVLQTQALSALMFTGASQFAFVGVLAAGGAGSTAVASATLLGVRNGLYGLQLSPTLQVGRLRRFLAAQLTIDESTAVSVIQPEPQARRIGFWATGIAVYLGWNAATLVGALVGNALGDPKQWGLDAAAAAAFLGLLWPRLRGRQAGAVAAASALVTVLVAPHVPAGIPIVVAALVAVAAGSFTRPAALREEAA